MSKCVTAGSKKNRNNFICNKYTFTRLMFMDPYYCNVLPLGLLRRVVLIKMSNAKQ